MRPSLNKQQILQDMGITVWMDRAAYLAAGAASVADVLPVAAPTDQAAAPATVQDQPRPASGSAVAGLAELNSLLGTNPSSTAQVAQGAQAQQPIPTRSNAASVGFEAEPLPAVADFVCYWSASVVLFADLAPVAGRDRLVKDLLAAATGDWQQKVQQAVFRWAEVGASSESTQAATSKAVAAFVNKRVVSAKAEVILISHGVDESVLAASNGAQQAAQTVAIPPLGVLAKDAVAKRDLWQSFVGLHG